MQLRIGGLTLAANSVTVASDRELVWNEGNQPVAEIRRLDVQGILDGDSQGALKGAVEALEIALAGASPDIVLLHDDGSESHVSLRTAGSLTGVRITRGASFPGARPGDYCTFRDFRFAAEAEYPVGNSSFLLWSWTETVALWGGGPVYITRRALNGPPQRQLVYPAAEFGASQEGEIVGYAAYPPAPPPLFPGALKEAGRFVRRSPRRRGNGHRLFPVSYSYQFESPAPLLGIPNVWVS